MKNKLIEENLDSIRQLCLTHGVLRLDVFGSVLTHSFDEKSDLDFLVDFKRDGERDAFHQYFEMKEALESLLGRPVDLVCVKALRNPIFKSEVEATSQLLYAA